MLIMCMGVGRIFPGGAHWWIFAEVFLGGAKSGEVWFLPLESKQTPFLLKF